MPARALARSLHFSASTSKTPVSTPFPHPKPRLAEYHLDPSPSPSYLNASPPFISPTTPHLPPRRQPAYNPGGFGVQAHPGKGKERAITEVERRDAEIGREERLLDGRVAEGKEESEACYLVGPLSQNDLVRD